MILTVLWSEWSWLFLGSSRFFFMTLVFVMSLNSTKIKFAKWNVLKAKQNKSSDRNYKRKVNDTSFVFAHTHTHKCMHTHMHTPTHVYSCIYIYIYIAWLHMYFLKFNLNCFRKTLLPVSCQNEEKEGRRYFTSNRVLCKLYATWLLFWAEDATPRTLYLLTSQAYFHRYFPQFLLGSLSCSFKRCDSLSTAI